ncbi:MAG: hypothetical protein ACREVE_01345 [Gammaproteobacteria bacterium]
MINALVYLLLVLAFASEWLASLGAPRVVTLTPEIISAATVPIVALRLARDRNIMIPPKYIFLFGTMFVLIFAGIVTNTVQSGAVFAGLRTYFRYAPIFLLPLVYYFSDGQIKGYLKFVLLLALLQVPLAVYQKVTAINPSGDHIVGTLGTPGTLSIFLVTAIAMLTAFLVKRQIRLIQYVPLVLFLFIPTAINETVVTLVLLPLAFVLPVLLVPTERSRLRLLIPVGTFGALIIGVFAIVYNAQYGDRWGGEGGGLGTMIAEGRALDFLYRGATPDSRPEEGQGTMAAVGRLDAVVMPLKVVQDPVKHWLGNGIGNAQASFHELFEGDWSEDAAMYGVDFTAASKLMWEIGIIGLGLSFLFFWFVFQDSRQVLPRSDFSGAVALGWATTVPLLAATMFYTSLIDKTALGYLMWFMSGYIISKRCQQHQEAYLQREQEQPSPVQPQRRPRMPGVAYRSRLRPY